MKAWLLALLLLATLLSVALAKKDESQLKRKHGKFEQADLAVDDPDVDDDDDAADDEYAEEDVDVEETEKEKEKKMPNPCEEKKCRRGEMCIIDKKRRARCQCIPKCNTEEESGAQRFQVCSKRNVTYDSECALDRDHCLCRRQKEGCSKPKQGKIRLDYYGACQEFTPCPDREFKEFPGRMREWLYIVMKQLAQKAVIPDYLDMLEQAKGEQNRSHAVIWKFCDLDVDPHDRYVTRRELLFTIQSLKVLEHCLIPFLDSCDTDTDGNITLWEWGRCLGLEDGSIKDECKNIHKAAAQQK